MTQQSSQCTVNINESNICKENDADKAIVSTNLSVDSVCNGVALKATKSSSKVTTDSENVHVQQLQEENVTDSSSHQQQQHLVVARDNVKSKQAKRTPSNVSNKSVTFCLKYIYSWYPHSIHIDLVSINRP